MDDTVEEKKIILLTAISGLNLQDQKTVSK